MHTADLHVLPKTVNIMMDILARTTTLSENMFSNAKKCDQQLIIHSKNYHNNYNLH